MMMLEKDLNLDATELRLGLPGTQDEDQPAVTKKRPLLHTNQTSNANNISSHQEEIDPPSKAQLVGWPPIRSYRKNSFQTKKSEAEAALYVKVSMDGAPYLRKIDLKVYKGYPELLKAMEEMFKFKVGEYCEREGYNGSDYVPTYEDKDGDWMLVGDVPWDMFTTSCKRLRLMKGSEAKGLGCGM
ncbi:Auxin-responsive protein [Quillaja saponaria]|uniref:Auxin-induced protein n=1 Tax=Quillaja saponaria TaxID=32244 RepID=A0AAD7VJS5_QUISA|nr:Auxin-responsive protein [Quillaja saponaria]